MVNAQVVDPSLGDLHGSAVEVADASARHLEAHRLFGNCLHSLVGRDLECSSDQVTVEDHVQVLVGSHPCQQLVRDWLVRVSTGVAVGDASRQFLE